MAYMIDNKVRTMIAKYLADAAEWGENHYYEINPTEGFKSVLRRMGCSGSRHGVFFSDEAIHRLLTEINHEALVAEYGEEAAKEMHPEEDETLDWNVQIDLDDSTMRQWLPKLFFYCDCYCAATSGCWWNKDKLGARTYRKYMAFRKGFRDWTLTLAFQLAYMTIHADCDGGTFGTPMSKKYRETAARIDQEERERRERAKFRDKAKGALWGLVVGDCLGSPIQFSGKDDHQQITRMVECPVFNLPRGYWTDDSSMAMCIMDSYVRKGGYDLKDIGETFVKWFRDGYLSSVEGRSFDVGTATWNACQNIEANGSLVNGDENTQGNGSIMRFAPSWLIARKESDPAKVMHEISDLTHNSSKVRDVVDRFAGLLETSMVEGCWPSEVSAYKTREEVNNSGWAVSTLEAALWAFNTTSSFKEALVAAVNLGGDADTIGAVCGQIAGAHYGYSNIPREWIVNVKKWTKVDALIEKFLDAVL